jgi:sulfotransferase family protein
VTAVANYSRLDRLVHRLAFARRSVQLAAAELEESLFGRDLASVPLDRPIFVTSLPRAGTTVLLKALTRMPRVAAHTYRDMPFVMAPLIWSWMSGPFRKAERLGERAHGDGVTVGYNSPEAFEEAIWRTFWPEHYSDAGITLWRATDRNPEGEAFLARNMRKIILLRCGADAGNGRYVSKNNANIARLPLLAQMFPDARIVVPIRAPLEHAASLRRQHLNFLAQHADAPFVRRYMEDIGHLEFGALHRPIAFPGFHELSQGLDPREIDYWLAYWIAAFEHIATLEPNLCLVSHEGLREAGPAALARLCERLGLEPGGHLDAMAAEFRPAGTGSDDLGADPGLRERAAALHAQILGRLAVVGDEASKGLA